MLEKILKNKLVRGLALVGTLSTAACTFDPPAAAPYPIDASADASTDSGNIQNQGMDATLIDTGYELDSGSIVDSGNSFDGGSLETGIITDAGTIDTGYDAGQTMDAGVRDGAVSDAGIADGSIQDSGYDAGLDAMVADSAVDAGVDAGCNPTVQLNDLQVQAGQAYCFNFSNSSTNVPSECGNTVPYAPGHNATGPGSHGVVMPNCGRNITWYIFEGNSFDPAETSQNATGVFIKNFPSPPGMRTSALIVQDDQGDYGQDNWTIEGQ